VALRSVWLTTGWPSKFASVSASFADGSLLSFNQAWTTCKIASRTHRLVEFVPASGNHKSECRRLFSLIVNTQLQTVGRKIAEQILKLLMLVSGRRFRHYIEGDRVQPARSDWCGYRFEWYAHVR
jgi:hypothetical protein